MENVPDGCYIYHEKEAYIPYNIHHGHVTFNRGDAIDVTNIKPRLNQNRLINTNRYNKLVWNQYNKLWNFQKSIFIDPLDGTYRREFLIHFSRIIAKRYWSTKSFDVIFDTCNDLQTFMLLDNSGMYGVPIGINKATKSIILNDSVWWTWRDFKTKFNQNNIERYQNLDFR